MDRIIEVFVKEGLWVLLDGLIHNEADVEAILVKHFDVTQSDTEVNSFQKSHISKRLIQHRWQSQWLASKILKKINHSPTRAQEMTKMASFDQLLLKIKSPALSEDIIKDLYKILASISAKVDCKEQVTLSSDSLELLSVSLLHTPDVAVSIIRSLLSPCLPHLADSDNALTLLCNSSLNSTIAKCMDTPSDANKGVFLQLLSTVTESCDCLPNVKLLVETGTISEAEMHYTLIAKGGSPPRLLQAFCDLDAPNNKSIISPDGVIKPRDAFLLQSRSKQHWLLDYLLACYEAISDEEGKYAAKEELLAKPHVSLISPILLLMAWDQQCCDLNTIMHMINACKRVTIDPIFERLGFLSERRSTVMTWVQHQSKKCSPLLKCTVLNKLEKCSTLRVLYETDCFIKADALEVEKLLRKARSNEDWEITLFQGYTIISSVLDLIWTSVKHVSTSIDDMTEYNECQFGNKMAKIRSDLEHLQPLSFRLEMLENIFSLLFLRYEDLQVDDENSDSGGEDEEYGRTSSSATLVGSDHLRMDVAKNTSLTSLETIQSKRIKITSNHSRGFVCSPFMIKEILNCLSECLVDCSAAFYKQRSCSSLDSRDNNLDKQIAVLTQYTAEALWRLKLVSDLPQDRSESYVPKPQPGYPSTASSSDSEDEDQVVRKPLEAPQRKMSYSSRRSRSEQTDRSSESSSNTTGTGSVGSEGNRRIRHRARAEKKLPGESDSIVQLLLASPATLAILCLVRADVTKARQVVQLFQISDTTLQNEIKFLEMYGNLVVEVTKVKNVPSFNYSMEQSVLSPLEMVRKVASAGVHAVSITSHVESTLTLAPKVRGLDRIIDEYRTAANLLTGLSKEVMVACDAALTLGLSRDVSMSLLDVVSQHWTGSRDIRSGRNKGFTAFMTNIMDVFRSLAKLSIEETDQSLPIFLRNCQYPLNTNYVTEYSSMFLSLQESLSNFIEHSDSSKSQVSAIRKLIKICKNSYSYHGSQGIVDTKMEHVSYIEHVFWYLQTFSSLILKCTKETEENNGVFNVLTEGWDVILGRLVFEFDAPISHVERVCARLQTDLLGAVVSACCPNIQLCKPSAVVASTLIPAETAWAKISLNAGSAQHTDAVTESPGTLVHNLLTQFINELKNCCKSPILSPEDFNLASQSATILNILNETKKLSNANLDALKAESERIAFLCNVSNLLLLHGIVVLGADWGLVSPHWVERRAAYDCVGYHVGQMGFVPLSGLLYQLVGTDGEGIVSVHERRGLYWSMQEKRALFVLSQGTVQSPVMQIMDSSKTEQQLKASVANYLSHNVRVEGSLSEGCFALVIPRLVLHYLGLPSPSCLEHAVEAKDEPIVQQQSTFNQITHLATECVSHLPHLLAFLQSYAVDKLQLQLAEWADAWNCSTLEATDLVITVEEQSSKFGVILPSTLEVVSPESTHSSLMASECYAGDIGWQNRALSHSVRRYLDHHCWIISVLASRLRQSVTDMKNGEQTACLDRFLSEFMCDLAPLGDGNVTLAALQTWSTIQIQTLWHVLDKLCSEQQEIECIKLILSLPEVYILNDVKLQTFKDIMLYTMANRLPTPGINIAPWCLALCLGTAELRAHCVLAAIQFWPGAESIDTLKAILGETTLTPSTRNQVISTLHRVSIYQQVHQVLCYYQTNQTLPSGGWHEVCKLSESTPGNVLQSLIEAKQYRLCLPWAELHGIPHRAQHLVNASFLSLLLETETTDFSHAEKLLSSVPVPQAISICRRLLGSLTSLPSLKFVVTFALAKCTTWLKDNPGVWSRLQLWAVGLSILALLPAQEQQRDRNLASQPHLLLEQLLMNTRLATLASALGILRSADLCALPSDSPAQPIVFDSLLRQYATKALDFRVSRRVVLPEPFPAMNQDDDLLLSLSTGSTDSGPVPFVMPAYPPNKDQWVPNDEVTECMCCTAVSFSMFNRRHHCRRCGRVVCGTCSNHRTKVDGYGDLPVRTCDDCHHQLSKQSQDGPSLFLSEPSSNSSQRTTEWRLLGEEAHDGTVREEFAFEHAPSVALCLSILALHSEHAAAQPRFLLDAADQMLQLLVPSAPGYINPELDYGLVIKMSRSLVVAAKVRYAKAALNSGVAHCDRLLGQVDLLALMVRSGCASLLPVEPLPLSGHSLRHLRERLVAAELWPLALEVSTKSGLERGGVWAAWGKACLRSGRWTEAREHLAHCLQTPLSIQDPAPAPLLSEIISILEESNLTHDPAVVKQAQHAQAPALAVLHSLASLNSITQGRFPAAVAAANTKPLFYNEIQYYLRTYGSPASTLSFFLSHSDVVSALRYVRERCVDPDIFAEALYKPCLRQGLIGQLHKEMSNIDPSLELWKETLLHVGRLLERQGLYNCLYQLQLYAHDLVRAAMTCIRFYQAGARCYTDLSAEHLNHARSHLEEELVMVQWTPGLRRKESDSPMKESMEHSPSPTPETQLPLRLPARQLDHHVSTISRQLEVAKFLQHCEKQGHSVVAVAADLRKDLQPGTVAVIPTLFGSGTERAHVAALLLLCGKNVEEGFGIAFRIIQEFHLRSLPVYGLASKWLTEKGLVSHIEQLVNCVRSSGCTDSGACSNELLLQCIQVMAGQEGGVEQSEPLARLITDNVTKIKAHIVCNQLKSAYIYAVRLGRIEDVKIILAEAEKSNESHMIRICKTWLKAKSGD